MAAQELVTVYTLGDPIKAEIIRNALQGEGIRCFLEGINQADSVGLLRGEIKVQVPASDAKQARKIIEEHEAHTKPHGYAAPDED